MKHYILKQLGVGHSQNIEALFGRKNLAEQFQRDIDTCSMTIMLGSFGETRGRLASAAVVT